MGLSPVRERQPVPGSRDTRREPYVRSVRLWLPLGQLLQCVVFTCNCLERQAVQNNITCQRGCWETCRPVRCSGVTPKERNLINSINTYTPQMYHGTWKGALYRLLSSLRGLLSGSMLVPQSVALQSGGTEAEKTMELAPACFSDREGVFQLAERHRRGFTLGQSCFSWEQFGSRACMGLRVKLGVLGSFLLILPIDPGSSPEPLPAGSHLPEHALTQN